MRIAIFVNKFLPISGTFILRQIRGLLERRHTVDIFATGPVDPRSCNPEALLPEVSSRVHYLRDSRRALRRILLAPVVLAGMGWRRPRVLARNLNVFRYGRGALSLNMLFAAARVLQVSREPYDIIHCQYGPLGVVALHLREVGAISGKLVTSFRGYDATKFLAAHPQRYRRLFQEGDLFCPVSGSLRRAILAAGCDAGKVAVLATGVDCTKLTYSPRRRGAHEPTRLLTVARLVEKKGVAYALQAVARLIRQGRAISYVIAGDGILRPVLEHLIDQLDIGAHVRLMGWVDADWVARLMQEAHIFVAPSVTAEDGDQEGIPNVLKEAMATGLPVVSTWHSGIPELVEDGRSGLLVPERDAAALADRLAYLMDQPDLWPAMGWAGRMKVEREFDVDRLNDRLVELYQGLLTGDALAGARKRALATTS